MHDCVCMCIVISITPQFLLHYKTHEMKRLASDYATEVVNHVYLHKLMLFYITPWPSSCTALQYMAQFTAYVQ